MSRQCGANRHFASAGVMLAGRPSGGGIVELWPVGVDAISHLALTLLLALRDDNRAIAMGKRT
jgi:hypothetical protein